ncbi:IDEAL domain-containing protein [Paenibacillus daejeonensis]|uniref:IDEAL domain-containing protein n=1 Tax=Paenibacillus daejeonensis TaxID=135193 RepID=UPI000380AFDF|nr:IDEAL domain-containing protein [Paenibacillus daejeonensis]
MTFQIGDWVQGHTSNGELVHGYIETIGEFQGIIKLHVIHSDHESIINKYVGVREHELKKLEMAPLTESQTLRTLIDAALAGRDEAWFNELAAQLKEVQATDTEHDLSADLMQNPRLNFLNF